MTKYGLVLGGGGAKGSYEIGVWKALRQLEIPIIAVSGTSVGALNGAMIVQGDYEKAFELWTSISIEAVISMNKVISNLSFHERVEGTISIIKDAIYSGGLDVTPLKKLLTTIIDEERIRKSPVDFGIVTFSLTDKKPLMVFKENIPKGKMVDYLLASASFPAFKPMEIDGKKFIDGAVYDNMPISLMLQKNIYDVISVDVSGVGRVRKIKNKNLNVIQIKNSEHLGPLLIFDMERAKRNIEIGYYDTMRVFGRYKGRYYYLTETEHSRIFGEDHIKQAYSFLGIELDKKLSPQDRFIVYKLIKCLKKYSNYKTIRDINAVISAAAEITAEVLGVERVREYSLESLISVIIEKYNYKKNLKVLENFYKAIDDKSHRAILYRRLLAVTFPKICIANIFIALLTSEQKNMV